MTDQLGYQLRYDYDTVGRLRSITNSDNLRLVHYEYDTAGRMALKTLGNGVHTTYTYDATDRLEKLTNALPNGSALSFFNYTYDERGRRTAMATHYGAWTYQYDDLGQLTNAVLTSIDPQIPNQDLTYIYDAMGNRVRTVENGVVTDYTANNVNEYTQVGETNVTWDDDGNLLRGLGEDRSGQFDFDIENLLARVQGNQRLVQYDRNPLGNLANSSGGGASDLEYVWDPASDSQCVLKLSSGGALDSRSIHGAGLVAVDKTGQGLRYLCFDPMGNVSDMVDGTGTRTGSRVFEPFGSALSSSGQGIDDLGFGAEFGLQAGASGMTRMGVRFYDARSGRFISTDPMRVLTGEVSAYGYGRNNPQSYIDSSGNLPVPVITGIGGAVFGGVVYGLDVWRGNKEFNWNEAANSANSGFLKGLTVGLGPLGGVSANVVRGAAKFAVAFSSSYWVEDHSWTEAAFDGAVAAIPWGKPFGFDVANWGRTKYLSALVNASTGLRFLVSLELREMVNRAGKLIHSKILVPIFATDPNQKLVLTGLGERGYVQSGALIPYRIDFENDTNASAPAQAVFVTDRLASTLDWQTFELTEIAFGDERIALPPKTQHFETNLPVSFNGSSFVVHIQAGIRLDTGEAFCTFRSLDPINDLPPPATAGFLPPENGTGRGQGHVAFVIRPKASLATGTEIRNVALVDFDGRETVATDQVDPHNPGLARMFQTFVAASRSVLRAEVARRRPLRSSAVALSARSRARDEPWRCIDAG